MIQVAVMPAFIHCPVTEPVHGGGEPYIPAITGTGQYVALPVVEGCTSIV